MGTGALFAGHKMFIVRPLDSAAQANMPPLILHLVHDGEWFCEIAEKKGGWTPPANGGVQTSTFEWTLAQALAKLMDTMDKFGQYRLCTNNCRTFLHAVMGNMKETGPPELLNNHPSTDDEFKRMCIHRGYKLDIQPMWEYYACDRPNGGCARTRVGARTTDRLAWDNPCR